MEFIRYIQPEVLLKKTWLMFIVTLLTSFSNETYSQKLNKKRLENEIQKAIGKAYPASVRIWGFDTVSKQQMSAQFSGVVVSNDGHILTAAHVDVPGNTYKVMFPDGRDCIAIGLGKIVYTADNTIPDVAMMKIIDKGPWPFAELGISSALKVSTPCISIAYPETLNQPKPIVRFGYIEKVKNERGFIQSTCIMEPGDSGGPLFDCLGRVIGLHSAIGVPENENYEVPVDLYKKYWTALNVAKTYSSPPVADSIKQNLTDENVIPISALKKRDVNFQQFNSKYKSSCLSVISLRNNGEKEKTTGTLFALNEGFSNPGSRDVIISKSSLTGHFPIIMLVDGRTIAAKIIARDVKSDLVLLLPDEVIGGGVLLDSIKAGSIDISPGQFLFSPRANSVGVASVVGSKLFSLPKKYSNGFLGAAITYDKSPLSITRIQPGSEAENIGLKTGDELVSINDTAVNKGIDYVNVLQKCWPGDTIKIQLKRAGIAYTKTAVLGTMPKSSINHPAEFFEGGKSIRRDGFEQVFSHDATIKPFECGGPVFDLYGHFYGINIARYSRASTLTIPAPVVYSFINKTLKPKSRS